MRAAPHIVSGQRQAPGDIVLILALSMMVFFHRRIGFRILRPGWIIGVFVALILPYFLASTFPSWLLSFFAPWNMSTAVFAVLFAGRAFYLRHQHWEDMKEGSTWTTYNPGESYLGNKWAIYRFGEPAICIAIGYFGSSFLAPFLAWWFIVAGICFGLVERYLYHVRLHRDLDVRDNVTEGEFFSAKTDEFVRGGKGRASGTEASDIPTGLDSDLEALRRQRKG